MYRYVVAGFFIFFLFISGVLAENISCLSEKIEEIVKKQYGNLYEVEIDVIYLPMQVKKNIKKAQVKCGKKSRLYGKTIVPVYIDSKKYNVVAKISLYKDVYVADGNISRGSLLDKNNLRKATREVSSFFRFLPENDLLIKKYEAKNFIANDDILLNKMIIPCYSARTGESVVIVAKKGNVTVKCAGKILQNAYLNEKVKIENLSSKKRLKGVLIEPGVVLLEK